MPFEKIVIAPEIAARFPDARVGWLVADVTVLPNHPYADAQKEGLAAQLAARGIADGNLTAQPDIAGWREVYSEMGVKPSKFRSSLEALTRRIVKGQPMWNVSSVVDCYDCASVSTFLAMGAHDTARLDGTMTLRRGRAGEQFLPLGAGGEEIPVDPQHIVYADESKVCCWLWNHRDTRLAAVTEETAEAVFIVDAAFTPHTTGIRDGLDILAEHLRQIGCTPKESGIVAP